ncbi:MAG: ABC transporter permease subunit [Acetobacteraceae bacterium]|nr:ABC transporter permease subunit [Acetobacteraceae bacterium]
MGALRVFVYVVVAMMLLPVLITLPVALTTSARISFPPSGIGLRWFQAIGGDTILLDALGRSLWLAALSSLLAVVFALPCAFAVHRIAFPGRQAVEVFLTGPRMIPQIVFVMGMLLWFERLRLSETFTGLVIAHLVAALPFAFRTLLVGVAGLDRRLEWSSAVLGATGLRTFLRVVLPQLKTGLIAAGIFAFVMSFNNVTLALFLSGIGQRTLPVEMFTRMYVGGMTPAIPAIAFLLALAGLLVFLVLDRTVGVYRYLAGQG